jgi:hypothetical protein
MARDRLRTRVRGSGDLRSIRRVVTDEADDGGTVGEDRDVGAAADFFVESLLGAVGPDLAPNLFGESGERQQFGARRVEVLGHLGSLSPRASGTRSYWATTDSASGWSKVECSSVRTQGQEDFGVTDIKFVV